MILCTAHRLLTDAERVQAEQVAEPVNGQARRVSRELWRSARSNVLVVNPDTAGAPGLSLGVVEDEAQRVPVA